ncbi:MAG: hypothetical protein HND58_00070 [Planctomycetota bacterium]|nr:MAG: hypothetical protein HND58_00070 [Planctomycetota bacterium]
MRTARTCRHLLIAAATILIPAAAFAQTTTPPPATAPPPAAEQAAVQATGQAEGQAAPEDASGAAEQADAATAEGAADAAAAPYAGTNMIARWMRAIGGRICMGPRLDVNTRVSRPNPNDAAQGWRVSVPTFALARMSAPPKRATRPTPSEQVNEAGSEQVLATGEGSTEIPD